MHIIVSNEGKFIKGLLGKIGCDFIFKRLCLHMSIAEYCFNREQVTMNNTIFSNPYLEFYFVFLTNKNIVYLLVKFVKWME